MEVLDEREEGGLGQAGPLLQPPGAHGRVVRVVLREQVEDPRPEPKVSSKVFQGEHNLLTIDILAIYSQSYQKRQQILISR